MSFSPYTLSYDASPAQITAIRAKLGIPSYQQSGKLSDDEGVLDWRVTPAGFEVTVQKLNGFVASHAPESVVKAKIAERIGLA